MSSHPQVTIDESIMQRLREICLPLPEAVEAEAFGAPTFKIRNKNFAMVGKDQNGQTRVWCKSTYEAQQALVNSEPERYYVPPYVGHKGWVAAWLDDDVDPDWDQIDEIITDSYRMIAPKRLVKALDEGSTLLGLYGSVEPRSRPEDFADLREDFEIGVAEEVTRTSSPE
jgi:hypothetical protein